MKHRVIVSCAVLALAAAASLRVPAAQADPLADTFSVKFTECTGGGGCTVNGVIAAGEPVTTVIHTDLTADGGSPYAATRLVSQGITPSGTVPAGTPVGVDVLMFRRADGTYCSGLSASEVLNYTIYATLDAGAVYPILGYASGLTATETPFNTTFPTWIQDFDDDNNNNIVDFAETSVGDILPQSVQDISPADLIPDGAEKEPLYLPILDELQGQVHNMRYFGDAVVSPNVIELSVDYVIYTNYPAPGSNTLLKIAGGGAALAGTFLPADNRASSKTLCPPLSSDVTLNATAGGNTVQTASATGGYQFEFSTAADIDGDGIPNYQDNCDLVPNTPQLDMDGDGIGDACDQNVGAADGAVGCVGTGGGTSICDVDNDGFPNYIDNCPYVANTYDQDGDGIDNGCDPVDVVPGKGDGYPAPAPGTYHDHDQLQSATFTLPMATNTTITGTESTVIDSNDNGIPDAAEVTGTACASSNPPVAPIAGCVVLGFGVAAGDSDGDTHLDPVDADPLDPNVHSVEPRSAKCAAAGDCGHDTSAGLNGIPTIHLLNVWGDGCNDTDEAALSLGGHALDQTKPWAFYDVPSNLLSAPNPRNNFRTAGVLSAAMAQSVFAYFKAGAQIGTRVYDQDLNYNNVMDGLEYDRGPAALPGGPPSAPDGSIGAAEAQKMFAEFKVNLGCPTGGYRLNDTTWNG